MLSSILEKLKNLTPEEQVMQTKRMEEFNRKLEEERHQREVLSFFRRQTGLPEDALSKYTFENYQATAENQRVVQYLRNWRIDLRFGFYLHGGVGLGKTHLAKALMIKNIHAFSSRLRNVSTFFDSLRSVYSQPSGDVSEEISRVTQHQLLILDDLGTQKPTDWMQEKLLQILDLLISDGKILIVTSNFSPEGLSGIYDARILDRLKQLVQFLELRGESHRNVIYRQNRARLLDSASDELKKGSDL